MIIKMKKIVLLLLVMALPLTIMAETVEINGIYYNLKGSKAEVTYDYEHPYSGSITIPSRVTYKSYTFIVSIITDYAFQKSKVTSVSIPSTVTSIGEYAFRYCSSLTTVTIGSGVQTIGWAAFDGCTNLTSVNIPNGVTEIDQGTFRDCVNLPSITIPSSVTTISSEAFENCRSLTSISIPSKVSIFCGDAIKDCCGLTSITVDSGNTKYDSRDNCNAIIETATNKLVAGCMTTEIPNSVTSIGYSAFDGCSNLTAITIPDAVTTIGQNAFRGCSSLAAVNIPDNVTSLESYVFYGCSNLDSVTIPGNVTNIWQYAFANCSGLSSLIIPSSVTSIKNTAFSGCTGLESIQVEEGNVVYDSRDGCNAIIEKSTNILMTGCKNTTIPHTVTSIEENAFLNCASLDSIIIPGNVKAIGASAFKGCTGLLSTNIGRGVTSIGDYAFSECTSLAALAFDNSPVVIGKYAFSSCTSLTSLTIPEGVTAIDENAFQNCSELTSITIGDSVKTIAQNAFLNCTNVTDVILGKSVKSIGGNAFYECGKLTTVTVRNPTPPSLYSSAIRSTAYKTLFVPYGTKALYQAASNWKEFGSIVEIDNRTEQYLPITEIPSMSYGDAAYTLPDKTSQELDITWTSGDTDIVNINGNMLTIVNAGTTTITATQAGDSYHYPLTQEFSITVAKASLVVTADDAEKYIGEENPDFVLRYEGFVYDDDESCLTVQPTVVCIANTASGVGTYPITVSGADSPNYEITYVNGTLTVNQPFSSSNTLSVSPAYLHYDEPSSLSICLDNEDTLLAFEFYMQLPEGITIALDEDGYPDAVLSSNRSNRHILEVSDDGNGLYHFLCYSNRNNALKGNSGELLSVNLTCSDDMDPGVYQGLLQTVKFSDEAGNRIVLADTEFEIKVVKLTMGDVNDDGDIDVMDVVAMVNYIMDSTTSQINVLAADIDGDGIVDVMDLVKEVRIIMNKAANTPATSFDLSSNELSLLADEDGALSLGLGDGNRYLAAQFVVKLSHGQRLADVTTDRHHTVSFEPVADDRYIVVSYSTSNSAYADNEDALTLHLEGVGYVALENITLVNEDKQKEVFQNTIPQYTVGIHYNTYSFTQPADIYSVSGMLLKKDATSLDGLRSGVYCINGKKYIIK